MQQGAVSVRVWGDFACFTRPEHKVERVSYPVMTPSAARGVLDAIYWHPRIRWRIDEIRVLKEVRTYSLVRNEVNSVMSPGRAEPFYADHDRAQRHSVCLRDVDYVIAAQLDQDESDPDPPAKHLEIFRRRVERGQCYHRPYLGTREFAAEFQPADDAPAPIHWTEDLGLMLWDLGYPGGTHGSDGWRPNAKPPYWPLFFAARVEEGVLRVPRQPIGGRP